MTPSEIAEALRPVPKHHYPAPWRVAENAGDQVVVVCAEGNYTCNASSQETAQIIVAAVNALAGVK